MDKWPVFAVTYRIKVKARHAEAAHRSIFHVLCNAEKQGLDWELIEAPPYPLAEVVNDQRSRDEKIRVQKVRKDG